MKTFAYDDILKTLPQKPPFMFVDTAEIDGDTVRGSYLIRGDEDFLKGHFPKDPIFPGSIMLEGLGQLAIFLLLHNGPIEGGKVASAEKVFLSSIDGVRCMRICRPGDRLDYFIKLKRLRYPLAMFEGKISVGSQSAVVAEKIALTFDLTS